MRRIPLVVLVAAALLGTWTLPTAARADEPLSRWLTGLGEAAQALSAGKSVDALAAALAARSAIPLGAPGARADLELGLALAARGQPLEAAPVLGAPGPGAPRGRRCRCRGRVAPRRQLPRRWRPLDGGPLERGRCPPRRRGGPASCRAL